MVNSNRKELIDSLHLTLDGLDDEDLTDAISACISSAVTDCNPGTSLQQIYHALSRNGSASLLDPLAVLPQLLPCRNDAAKDIMSLMGECSNAKEVIIAIQEAVERLESKYTSGGDDDREDMDDQLSLPMQLILLVSVYSASLPRLKLRKKTASETISPLLSDLESAVKLTVVHATKAEGRQLITVISHLVTNVLRWVQRVTPENDTSEITKSKGILKSLLDITLVYGSQSIDSSLAQRSFEARFPRLVVRSAVRRGWEDGEKTVSDAVDASTALGFSPQAVSQIESLSSLILVAHSTQLPTFSSSQFSDLLPIFMASLRNNTAIDETLFFLLSGLSPPPSPIQRPPEYLVESLIPLVNTISPLASVHPDPSTRHLTFRILSLALGCLPSLIRLQTLHSLASESEFPQMRVASVGLVKEAVLVALSKPASEGPYEEKDIFASRQMLQILGPVLLRPNPTNLFEEDLTASVFLQSESSESKRLVECLSFYYVLLQRDKQNLTGVRDGDMMENVEKTLLSPLRLVIGRWMNDSDIANGQMADTMLLASLQMCLERVDGAIANL